MKDNSKAGAKTFLLYNAHGDVVNLANDTGSVVKSYQYDAFGVEKDIDPNDTNPFRYCGEYFDKETITIYLRARYYSPISGRFTQEDTHWNVENMVYSADGSISMEAILQSGNLYGYCMGNPVNYSDSSGDFAILTTLAVLGIGALACAGTDWLFN